MPSKPKEFLPQDELVSDTDGVCPWPCDKSGTRLSVVCMYFSGNIRGQEGKGRGKGRTAQGGMLWHRIIWWF